MNSLPKISIITVVYNDAIGLEETIISVINQTYLNIEYIIIDGQSDDRTLDIINKYKDNITYWTSEPDKGIYDAMNKGIDSSTGDWINFMNAGDIFYNNNVLENIFYLNDTEKNDVLFGKNVYKYEMVRRIRQCGNLKELWKGMQFCHQSTFIKTNVHKKFKFDLQYMLAGDYNLIFKLFLANKKFKEVDTIISINKVEGTTYSNVIKSLKERFGIALKFQNTLYVRIYYLILLLKNYIRRAIPSQLIDNYYANKYKNHKNI